MVSQSIWIGITIGVFFAGVLVGIGSFTGSMNMWNMPMQNQQTMMQDPQFQQQAMNQLLANPETRNQMMESITQNPETMGVWMQNSQHAEDMGMMMRENHDFAMQMMYTIIEDPAIRLQMLGHMTENPETMDQLRSMMDNMTYEMMDSGMMMDGMKGGMMDSGMMNKDMMMQDPETREKMIQIMAKHIDQMQKLLSMELTDEEFNSQMIVMMHRGAAAIGASRLASGGHPPGAIAG